MTQTARQTDCERSAGGTTAAETSAAAGQIGGADDSFRRIRRAPRPGWRFASDARCGRGRQRKPATTSFCGWSRPPGGRARMSFEGERFSSNRRLGVRANVAISEHPKRANPTSNEHKMNFGMVIKTWQEDLKGSRGSVIRTTSTAPRTNVRLNHPRRPVRSSIGVQLRDPAFTNFPMEAVRPSIARRQDYDINKSRRIGKAKRS